MKTFQSIFPYDQSLIAEYPLMDDRTLANKLSQSQQAFDHWHKTTFQYRADLFIRLAAHLRRNRSAYARLITQEMGKILPEAEKEIDKSAVTIDFYVENGEKWLQNEVIQSEAHRSYVRYEPAGAVFAIMPWNFPFWQVLRFAIPNLLAGNVALLKHAPNVCGCAWQLETIFRETGFPEGIFQTLVMDVDKTESILQSDVIHGVTLTGSEYAGSSVASLAGKHIKKTVLELGGSDPLIVLADADLEKAATTAVQSRMQNAGQSCIAAKRFIVLDAVYEDFTERILQKIKGLRQGNPMESGITTGPMARLDLAEKLNKQLVDTQQLGGKLLTGGERNEANFQPALLVNVPVNSPAFHEETFGPVAAVISVKTEAEAIEIANASRYGLGASIWTKDLEKAGQLAQQICSGSVYINTLVKSTAPLPFGGTKKSGYGRELSAAGMREFMNVKTVYVDF
jgi:succinate-semialdehyde dehydrogenase / glutarate-semialdehyde dehydrogenase